MTAAAEFPPGTVADITAWDDDDRTIQVTYRAATVLGVTGRNGAWLTIRTTGAEMTDAETGEVLGVLPAVPELNVPLAGIFQVEEAS
jgi:hypothetical protein